jgi:hypothetical protein
LSRGRARSRVTRRRAREGAKSDDFLLSTRREIDTFGTIETGVQGASATAEKEIDRDSFIVADLNPADTPQEGKRRKAQSA